MRGVRAKKLRRIAIRTAKEPHQIQPIYKRLKRAWKIAHRKGVTLR
jgi:hypothetical protein